MISLRGGFTILPRIINTGFQTMKEILRGGKIKNNISHFLASLESGDYEELFLF